MRSDPFGKYAFTVELGPAFSPAQLISRTTMLSIAIVLRELQDQLGYADMAERLDLQQRKRHYHHFLFQGRSSYNKNLLAVMDQ
ncbi:hypothetical protein KIN20_021718 [Parelaphostrongylus tenuis]|uniref:Uncharacterized protein n=1 Tax=Parelaphostrongylus tenuis TaxID=148309 RepID=A0AAD5QUP6_PARTN|nr:hypothetical protein KIN20_021718 [Parelaphostrongylus tenuis]